MTNQKNIIVIFTEKANIIFSDIVKKYNLEESEEADFQKMMAGKLPVIVIVKKIIRAFAGQIITKKDFEDSLKKILFANEQKIQVISKDIIENLIPLLDIVFEDELEEYNRKRSEMERKNRNAQTKTEENTQEEIEAKKKEIFMKAKEELLRKLRAEHGMSEPEPEEVPNTEVKTVPIADVEDNAKAIQHEQEKDEVVPAEKVEEKAVDPYKEQVE